MTQAEVDVVWANTVDNETWVCQVVRTDDYRGRLTVHHKDQPDAPILDREVGLAYGAVFGPDVADVAAWQDQVIEAIDSQEEQP